MPRLSHSLPIFVWATICVSAVADDKPLFEEPFSGKLSAGWTWVDEQSGTWRLSADGLDLKVVSVGEGLWQGGRKHPNLLLRDPGTKGDFAVEVELKNNPTAEFEHAGLLLYADGDNYVVINKEMIQKSEIVFVSEKGAKPTVRQKPYEHEEICLRLAIVGKKVTGQYRHYDSDAWQTLGELELPTADPYKVGVFAGRGPKDADHRAVFSNFRILPVAGPAAKAPPAQVAAKDAKPAAAPAAPQVKRKPMRSDLPAAIQARQTAERAIPYIAKDGAAWINDRKCLSCHYAGYMLWSFREAGERGFAIDDKKLAEWTNWSLAQEKGQGPEGAAQLLIARDRSDKTEPTKKRLDFNLDMVLKAQEKDGFWKAGGQLPGQKRPLPETTQVSTMLCVLALDALDEPNDKVTEARDKGLAWLKKTPVDAKNPAADAVSGEWYTMKLLIEKKFGDRKTVEALRDKILAAQQADDGRGWLWADKSDAFGTGLALYALAEAGVPNTHPAIQRGWKFLIETQTDAGSWIVNGTKTATKDKPHPFSGFWGTTWALMGLTKSLPDAPKTAATTP